MVLELIDKEECSTTKNRGTRIIERKKLEAKNKEILTSKEVIRKVRGHKYRYLIYWDKTQNRQRQKLIGKVEI